LQGPNLWPVCLLRAWAFCCRADVAMDQLNTMPVKLSRSKSSSDRHHFSVL
uniref:Uncharacterized protein n=1 Tax=Aegilops tauschii subsp. strangulata TaxID=200361 RepID=A0A452YE86_AEGTS